MNTLPAQFTDRLTKIIPSEYLDGCLDNFARERSLSVRINNLRSTKEAVLKELKGYKVIVKEVPWYSDARVLEGVNRPQVTEWPLIKNGNIYIQELSSMLAALILGPKPEERILDMCAAPGSKASQMASLMKNQGELVCLESVRNRYYKLRSVLSLLRCECSSMLCKDGRKYRDREGFDRILVDAPCSSEGRFKTFNKKSFAYWSMRKIKEMKHKQKGLLLNASRLLKEGGKLLYATCTFAPEENEEVVSWILKKTDGELISEPISFEGVKRYPPLMNWEGKTYDQNVGNCLRVLPGGDMEGFFLAKFRKL